MGRFVTMPESCLDGAACSDCGDDDCDCRNCARLNAVKAKTSLAIAKSLVSSKTLLVEHLIIDLAQDRSEKRPAEKIAATEQKLTIARREHRVAVADLYAKQKAAA